MERTNQINDHVVMKSREVMPNIAFEAMTAMMRLRDLFTNYAENNIKNLNLERGQTVLDYGCGPGRYVQIASSIVGETGEVIAVDIHPIAIKMVNSMIKKHGLLNVKTVLSNGYNTGLPSEIADVIFVLDMFHMIEDPAGLLSELYRLIKPEGRVIIEDGHQPRVETKKKIENAGVLKIIDETKSFVECRKNA